MSFNHCPSQIGCRKYMTFSPISEKKIWGGDEMDVSLDLYSGIVIGLMWTLHDSHSLTGPFAFALTLGRQEWAQKDLEKFPSFNLI